MARIIVVTSGKGGVGKTTFQRGHRHWFGPEGKENCRDRF
ncbi:Septum formation inhibitor-activating ATPase [Escherichia coli]|uniref:Septum formation inhibitor-activating ATPase n=1 Tax=Escherichia coli TaxID=562 RepID=A0A2X3JFX9_ECOLX|nr:Septum formation inhibitor-activating ATPase [Escherichia coli]